MPRIPLTFPARSTLLALGQTSWSQPVLVHGNSFCSGVGLSTSLFLTSQVSCLLISPACWGLFEGQHLKSAASTTSPSFVLPTNLSRVHSLPSSKSVIKIFKKYWQQYQPLLHTTNAWPTAGLCATDYNTLNLTVQPFSSPPHCPLL